MDVSARLLFQRCLQEISSLYFHLRCGSMCHTFLFFTHINNWAHFKPEVFPACFRIVIFWLMNLPEQRDWSREAAAEHSRRRVLRVSKTLLMCHLHLLSCFVVCIFVFCCSFKDLFLCNSVLITWFVISRWRPASYLGMLQFGKKSNFFHFLFCTLS